MNTALHFLQEYTKFVANQVETGTASIVQCFSLGKFTQLIIVASSTPNDCVWRFINVNHLDDDDDSSSSSSSNHLLVRAFLKRVVRFSL
jgi:hypothetical protein